MKQPTRLFASRLLAELILSNLFAPKVSIEPLTLTVRADIIPPRIPTVAIAPAVGVCVAKHGTALAAAKAIQRQGVDHWIGRQDVGLVCQGLVDVADVRTCLAGLRAHERLFQRDEFNAFAERLDTLDVDAGIVEVVVLPCLIDFKQPEVSVKH